MAAMAQKVRRSSFGSARGYCVSQRLWYLPPGDASGGTSDGSCGGACSGGGGRSAALERAGKKIYFMTNNSSRGTESFRKKFEAHGLGTFATDERRLCDAVWTLLWDYLDERRRRH